MKTIDKSMIKKYLELSGSFLEDAYTGHKDENVVISPLSLLMVLGLAINATSGESQKEIKDAISTELSVEEINDVLVSLQKSLIQKKKNSKLSSSNAVCVKDDLYEKILTEFKKLTQKSFGGEIFAANEDMAERINEWVSKNTDGMIDELQVPDNLKLAIMNAIAFSAKWEVPYEDDDIDVELFNNSDGTEAEVDMLSSGEDGYIEDKDFEGFIKPYKGDKYELMCLLPKRKMNSKILAGIDFKRLYEKNNLEYTSYVRIPEFEIKSDSCLNEYCRKLGINKIFDPDAEFAGMFGEGHEPLKAGSILQKAHIKVDREGTKAAAVTEMEFFVGCAPDFDRNRYITFDRPFVYAIMDKEYKIPVFTGVVNSVM